MARRNIPTLICLLVAPVIFAQSRAPITGKWKGEEKKDLIIDIYQATDSLFYGKDQQGKVVLRQLQFDSKSSTYKGKMVPPDKDIALDLVVFTETTGKLKLVARKFVMTKTFYLTKIK